MNFVIALTGGIITFISPCVLPLIPIYIAYVSGTSIQAIKGETPPLGSKSPLVKKPFIAIFINSIFFVIGFAVIFSSLAALFYIFVQSLGNYKIWFNRISGIILIIFGLQMMGIINLKFLNYEFRVQPKTKKASFLSSFIMGAAFGAGWTPCIGPILSGILFTSASSHNSLTAILLLLTYSLGLGIPFILTGLLTGRLISLFDVLKKHSRAIEIFSGLFLAFLGVVLFFDLMGVISGFFSGLLPMTGDIENKIVK